jgi:hypothetical protein
MLVENFTENPMVIARSDIDLLKIDSEEIEIEGWHEIGINFNWLVHQQGKLCDERGFILDVFLDFPAKKRARVGQGPLGRDWTGRHKYVSTRDVTICTRYRA